jgi:hypothetical protein
VVSSGAERWGSSSDVPENLVEQLDPDPGRYTVQPVRNVVKSCLSHRLMMQQRQVKRATSSV